MRNKLSLSFFCIVNEYLVWSHTLMLPAVQRQEDHNFTTDLSYIARACLKRKTYLTNKYGYKANHSIRKTCGKIQKLALKSNSVKKKKTIV